MKLAIFDFDGTLFEKETIPYLFDKWDEFDYSSYAKTSVRRSILKKYFMRKIRLISKENFRSQATLDFLRIFDDLDKEEIENFFKKSTKDIKAYYNKNVLEEIDKSANEGYTNVMISGCFQIMLDYALESLPFDYILGTKIPISESGINFDRNIEIISGLKKKELLLKTFEKEVIDWKNSKAFGDSLYDRYIMELTGFPTAVSPDNDLRTFAEKNNWRIID